MRSRWRSSRSAVALFIAPENSGSLRYSVIVSGLIPARRACFLVRQPDGDSFGYFGDHFRRALGWPSFAKPPTLADDGMCWFPVHALVSL